VSAYRTQRHKALPLIVDFLDRNYPCDCPRTDPCGSSTAEAIEIVQTVLEAVAADTWDEGFTRGVGADNIDAALHETREIDLNPYRASETA